jgi:hypothetical protein
MNLIKTNRYTQVEVLDVSSLLKGHKFEHLSLSVHKSLTNGMPDGGMIVAELLHNHILSVSSKGQPNRNCGWVPLTLM